MEQIDPDHRSGTSDATPGGEPGKRRPGELAFAAFLLVGSLGLLWSAWGIDNPFGPNGLSAPRAIPVAATLAMVVAAGLVLLGTARLPLDRAETLARDILPGRVVIFALFLLAYGLLLRPLGFLPTSAMFLIAATRLLGRRGWGWTLAVSLGSLMVIWLVFRIVFSVLMPAGVMPEAEIIQAIRSLIGGGAP
jgi:hypothetical protein